MTDGSPSHERRQQAPLHDNDASPMLIQDEQKLTHRGEVGEKLWVFPKKISKNFINLIFNS
jgi:hypothetical protein